MLGLQHEHLPTSGGCGELSAGRQVRRNDEVMDPRLVARAVARGDVFTRADVLALDLDDRHLRRICRSGEAIRVRRNAYVLGVAWEGADPTERFAMRTRAVLAARQNAHDISSHRSALALHGLPVLDPHLADVELASDVLRVRRDRGFRLYPRAISSIDPEVSGATPDELESGRLVGAGSAPTGSSHAVPIPVAVVQTLLGHGLPHALVALDAALHEGRCTTHEVEAVVARLVGAGARSHGYRLIRLSDPRCESVGESRARLVLVELGLDVRSQVAIYDDDGDFVGRVDFLVDGDVVVEFDGAVKYDGAEGRDALVAEKIREDRLRALGYRVIRLTWADLDRPSYVAGLIRRARGS